MGNRLKWFLENPKKSFDPGFFENNFLEVLLIQNALIKITPNRLQC